MNVNRISALDAIPFSIRLADWHVDQVLLSGVRRTVFIQEQGIPEALEWDEDDAIATHILALDIDGNAVGTARLLADGYIGRVAVLKNWRGKGVGSGLLKYLIILNKNKGGRAAQLSAQVRAMPFYARHGFVAEGATYLDADIPHRMMRLEY